jgi:hypothetical protein
LDYAKGMQTRQSVTRYVVYLENAPTMHRSVMQETVALSSCEAKLNTAVLRCAQDMMYQNNKLESIGLKVELPMILEMHTQGVSILLTVLVLEVARDILMLNSASCESLRKQKSWL